MESKKMNQKNKVILSIIIPNYNKDKYLKRCLDSIISQLSKNIEIIVVDDCSTDSSIDILKQYDNLILIKNKNILGISESRNIGIKYAKGKYISFMDADDYLSSNYVELIMEKIKSNDDLYIFNVKKESNSKVYSHNLNGQYSFEYYIRHYTKDFLKPNISYWVWNKIFKKSILDKNNIKFKKCNYAEDENFCIDYFHYIDKINFVEEILYVYCMNSESYSKNNEIIYSNAFSIVENNNLKMFLKYKCDLNILKCDMKKLYEVGILKTDNEDDRKKLNIIYDKLCSRINNTQYYFQSKNCEVKYE